MVIPRVQEGEARQILVIDGHPDPRRGHFVHALADQYVAGAVSAGHLVRRLDIAPMSLAPLRTRYEWEETEPPAEIAAAQEAMVWADHMVIFYPLWLGDMPSLLKAFFEQALCPGFAFSYPKNRLPHKALKGRSAHVVVTMGMPSIAYRLYYRAHSLKSLKRNILKFVGISPVRTTVIGGVEGASAARDRWLLHMSRKGADGH